MGNSETMMSGFGNYINWALALIKHTIWAKALKENS